MEYISLKEKEWLCHEDTAINDYCITLYYHGNIPASKFNWDVFR